MIWNNLISTLNSNTTFLITSHASPDGDCIGSQLAMYWYLQSLGKQVTIYNVDPTPSKFIFLQNSDRISTQLPSGPFDVMIVLDSSNLNRLGWDGHRDIARQVLNIDHHRDNTNFGALNFVRQSAGTGEILYDFFTESGITFPVHVAEDLYTAIITDTGGFRFSNTNGRVLKICGDLADRGVNPAKIHEWAYATHSRMGMVLLSRIWSTLSFHLDDRVCSLELPLNLIEELGAAYGDSEGSADLTIMVPEVQVGFLIKHTAKQTHFSLRSKDRIDVGAIAKLIPGGGGHCNAAGCTIEEPVGTALPKMLEIIRSKLD